MVLGDVVFHARVSICASCRVSSHKASHTRQPIYRKFGIDSTNRRLEFKLQLPLANTHNPKVELALPEKSISDLRERVVFQIQPTKQELQLLTQSHLRKWVDTSSPAYSLQIATVGRN